MGMVSDTVVSTYTARGTLRLSLTTSTDTPDSTDSDTPVWDTLLSALPPVSSTPAMSVSALTILELPFHARRRGRLMLMLRPMLLSFTPDTDIPPTDTPASDTPDSDTPTTVLLLLPLLLPLLPLLLLPSPPSTTPFSEPRLCPTLC